ncbi:GH92 family glycosyl hydrolase [Capsulimonas corticalis]|nr:GH92 family glycosyl hydrolase [Capsulimonas corticalis]
MRFFDKQAQWAAGLAAAMLMGGGSVHALAPVDEIDPTIGTITTSADGACGKTFPGPATPFGLVQLSPDTITGGDNGSGYSAEMTTIEGFSFLHMSGVGCYGDLGNLQVMPETGSLVIGRDEAKSPYRKETEVAKAGYYGVQLDRYHVKAELTAAPHAGMLRFTFPASPNSRIKVDLTRRIGASSDSHSSAQWARQTDDHTVEGWMRCDPSGGGWGCGPGPTYTVYFSMQFAKPIKAFGTWDGGDISRALKQRSGSHTGFFVEFPTKAGEQVTVKSGISFVSIDGARANLAHDIPGWSFDAVRDQARSLWAAALSRAGAEGGAPTQRRIFNTALYHTMLDPRSVSDVDGSYIGADHQEHKAKGFVYRSIFSGWDVFRADFPLQTIVNPSLINDEVNSLIQITELGGARGLARWELMGTDAGTMVGDPGLNVICEAYLKGIRGYDAQKAYAMARGVGLGPADKSNRNDFDHWTKLGYCADGSSLSETLENSYSDYALARFATALGKTDAAAQLLKTAQNYRNLFNSGDHWFRGRNPDGGWMAADAGCVESIPTQQGWFVPQDIAGLIGLVGGRDKFVARLNDFFVHTPPDQIMRWNNFYNHSNEPVHQCAFMFTYAGAPWLTQKWSRFICDNGYKTGPGGLDGNDDVGQMSAWYVLASAGLYPVSPASGVYILGSPIFPKVTLRLDPKYAKGKSFTISAPNTSAANIYVQSATLNGKPLTRAWVTHEEIARGGTLSLKMGPEPNKLWGAGSGEAPPSITK